MNTKETIEEVGIITRPGKFEGEREYMPLAYETYMAGFSDSDNEGVVTVTIMWQGKDRTVRFFEDDQGFIREVLTTGHEGFISFPEAWVTILTGTRPNEADMPSTMRSVRAKVFGALVEIAAQVPKDHSCGWSDLYHDARYLESILRDDMKGERTFWYFVRSSGTDIAAGPSEARAAWPFNDQHFKVIVQRVDGLFNTTFSYKIEEVFSPNAIH